MDYRQRLIHAYEHTPWRRQLQFIGLFLASVVFLAVIAGVYLDVTSRASTIGREIQAIQGRKQVLEREIEDIETRIAHLSTAEMMKARAEDLNFVILDTNQITYIKVDGYPGVLPAELAPSQPIAPTGKQSLPKEYTVSLVEWARETIYLIGLQTGAEQIEGFMP